MTNLELFKIDHTNFQYEFIADWIYYEGSILSQIKINNKTDALILFYDITTEFVRWLVVELSDELLTKYFNNEIGYKDLIESNETYLLFDHNKTVKSLYQCGAKILFQDFQIESNTKFIDETNFEPFVYEFSKKFLKKTKKKLEKSSNKNTKLH